MKRITSAGLDKLERRAKALHAQVSAFDLDAWKAGREDLTTVDPDWLATRQARLQAVAARWDFKRWEFGTDN